jgi:ankyrin repeat protein
MWGLDIAVPKEKPKKISIVEKIKSGNYKEFKKLLPHINVTQRYNENWTLLHYASRFDRENIAKTLVEKGAPLNAVGGQYVETPLHMAIRYGYLKLAVYLIKHKPNFTLTDKYGETPLEIAKRLNYTNIVELLKEYGAVDRQEVEERANEEQHEKKNSVNKYRQHSSVNPYKTNINAVKVQLRHNNFESEGIDKNNNNLLGEKNSKIEIGN